MSHPVVLDSDLSISRRTHSLRIWSHIEEVLETVQVVKNSMDIRATPVSKFKITGPTP
jgi:ribosome biogenesis GTPase A